MSKYSAVRSYKRGLLKKLNDNSCIIKYVHAENQEDFDRANLAASESHEKITLVVFKQYEVFKDQ